MDNDNITYQVLTTNRETGTEMTINLANLGDLDQAVHEQIYHAYKNSDFWMNTILQRVTVRKENIKQ